MFFGQVQERNTELLTEDFTKKDTDMINLLFESCDKIYNDFNNSRIELLKEHAVSAQSPSDGTTPTARFNMVSGIGNHHNLFNQKLEEIRVTVKNAIETLEEELMDTQQTFTLRLNSEGINLDSVDSHKRVDLEGYSFENLDKDYPYLSADHVSFIKKELLFNDKVGSILKSNPWEINPGVVKTIDEVMGFNVENPEDFESILINTVYGEQSYRTYNYDDYTCAVNCLCDLTVDFKIAKNMYTIINRNIFALNSFVSTSDELKKHMNLDEVNYVKMNEVYEEGIKSIMIYIKVYAVKIQAIKDRRKQNQDLVLKFVNDLV